ncbi:MAG: hypothetical protein PUB18_03155 [bacterium]|nr:hypothetical protein [bacterium]
MKVKEIEEFIEQVKLESTYRKFLKINIIYQLTNIFNGDFIKQIYSNKIEKTLIMMLI